MALSYVTYTGDGAKTDFNVTFDYISRSHVKVYLDGIQSEDFTWISDTQIRMDSAPVNLGEVKVKRETPNEARLVDFQNGSTINAETDLDTDSNQLFFISQESYDNNADAAEGALVNGSVNTIHLANNAVTAAKIADITATGTSTARDLRDRFADTLNVKDFGAIGDGTTDDTDAIQDAITTAETGDTIVFPAGSYKVTEAIVCTGKDITLLLYGKILDRCASWSNDFTNLTTTGKGLFAFTTGIITVRGCGLTHLDGGRGNGSTSQTARAFLYFYNCTGVTVESIVSDNGLGSTVATYKCSNVIHRHCLHNKGEFAVLHSRGTDVIVDDVTVTNALYNGISCLNRGGFSDVVLPFQAGLRIKVANSRTYSVTSTNSYAVGITIDNCDHFTCSHCEVDGAGLGTMAYSFAGSRYGVVSGNRALNMSNIANGSYTYAGIGMECDTVTQVEFVHNHFRATLLGYLILAANDCSFDGTYFCDEGRSAAVSTGAGQCAYVNINNPGTASNVIRISGIVDGGTYVVSILGTVNDLTLSGIISKDHYSRFYNVFSGAAVTRLVVSNVQVYHPGNAKDVFVSSDNTTIGVRMTDVRVEAITAPGTSKRFWFGESNGGVYHFSRCFLKNYDEGIQVDRYNRVTRVTVRDCHFAGVAGALFTNAGATVKIATEGCTLDHVAIQPTGNNAAIIYTTAAPATTPIFKGQMCVDTTNSKLYFASATASSADWIIVN
jgi:hypothetical protein